MKKRTHRKQSGTQTAMDFREFCRSLVKERIHTKEDKEKLAKALGLSFAAVDALVYRRVGSFETFLGAVFHLYSFDLDVLKTFILNYRDGTRRMHSVKSSDKIWFELDSVMSEEEKCYWASLIRATKSMDLQLSGKKNKDVIFTENS